VRRFQEEVLSLVQAHAVVLVRGPTGCGKTTQVPQYILDSFIRGGRASDCNIVVTQVTAPANRRAARRPPPDLLLVTSSSLPTAQEDQRRVGG